MIFYKLSILLILFWILNTVCYRILLPIGRVLTFDTKAIVVSAPVVLGSLSFPGSRISDIFSKYPNFLQSGTLSRGKGATTNNFAGMTSINHHRPESHMPLKVLPWPIYRHSNMEAVIYFQFHCGYSPMFPGNLPCMTSGDMV